jgi:hypothetical protein
MRPVTVTVGPVTNPGSPTSIAAAAAAPAAGQLLLNGVPAGGSSTASFTGACSVAGDVLTVFSTTTGAVTIGVRLMMLGLPANCVVTGPDPDTPGAWIINPPPAVTLATRAARCNSVTTLDTPRQVLITNTEPAGNSFTVYGTNEDGQSITEVLPTNGGNLLTAQNFATVTQVTIAAAAAGALSIGTTSQAESRWVNFDHWALGTISKQCVVNGAATYTVQITNDDPMSPTNPVAPDQVTWTNDPDATFVGATASLFGYWAYTPLWARVLLTAGTGSVTATFVQQDGGL